jgi:phosphotransferase system enzyme I (PtsI)
MSLLIAGIGVSREIAIGHAHILHRGELEVLEYAIPAHLIEDEISRFRNALEVARRQLREIRGRIPPQTRADIAAFIDTHLLMLEDLTLTMAPEQLIRSKQCNAEWALKAQRDMLVQVFEEMDDAYLRTRKDDIDHVVTRIQRILLNQADTPGEIDDSRLHGSIVFADDLTPADTVLMQHQGVAGFVTEYGGPLSHTAIIARSLSIPAVVGVHNVRNYIHDGELVIVDGQRGVIYAGADASIIEYYRQRQDQEAHRRTELSRLVSQPAVTLDGRPISLQANIELTDDVDAVLQMNAEGVGLYRTEFLFMNRDDPPDEAEQLAEFIQVIERLNGLPLTIRTLDLGADKEVDGSSPGARPSTNPALGLRAVRLCLKDPSLFKPQLRAILRASACGPVRMMIPMLSTIQEILQILQLIRETKQQLELEGLKYDPNLPVGGMIEVPAAALSAELFARHLDFLSIGTNDLIQYTLAIDRLDDEVNYLYDPLHPAVLRLISMVIEAGRKANIAVAMCGEMAGDICYTRLLLGLGLTEFSMQPASLLEVKRVVKNSDWKKLEQTVQDVLSCEEPARMRSVLLSLCDTTD